MNDIVDYSKKLNEEIKKQRKTYIIICLVIAFLTFSIGFYASYAFNNSNNANDPKNKFDTIYDILKEEWYYGIEDENIDQTLIDKAITGMIDTNKDPHTRYLTSLGSLADSYHGLGVSISEYKEYFIITDISSKINIDAGLKPGDIIKMIDGNSLENKDINYIKTLIENKESITLNIERNNIELTIKAYITTYTPVTVYKDFTNEDVAYIKISEFAEDTAQYLQNYLEESKNKGYTKLVLDLRDNPGGYISSVVECADLFLEKDKTVLSTKNKKGDIYSHTTKDKSKYDFDKIAIMINGGSASGAEALAAALNENLNDIVELVGVTTYGKGSAQKTIYFTDGTYFHYTYALWLTPSGNSINKVGVAPETVYEGRGIHLLDFYKITLKKNDYGEYVYCLQNVMKTLGYYSGELTSFFNEELEESLKTYQKDNDINETGELDELTLRYILAKYYDDKINDYANELNEIINKYTA